MAIGVCLFDEGDLSVIRDATARGGPTLFRQLVSGSAISLGLRILGVLISYLAHILLSRSLGLHDYGRYVIALGWATVLAVPARAGFDYAALRYTTVYWENRDWPTLRGFMLVTALVVTAVSSLFAIAVLIVPHVAGVNADWALLLWTAALIFPTATTTIMSVMMRSVLKIFASQFYDQVLRPALLVALILAGYAAGQRAWDADRAMFLTALAAVGATCALAVHFRTTLAPAFSVTAAYERRRDWFRVSLPLLLITAIQELLNQMQVILLGALADARAAGLFAAAWRLASLISFGLVALGTISGPLIASAFHRSDFGELGRLTSLSARIALAFAMPAAIVMVVAGPLLLELFGAEFGAAYPTLLVLTGAALVNAFTGVVAYLLTLTGRERQALIIFTGTLAANLLLNLLLIPSWGAVGAAIGSATSTVLWNLAMLAYVRRLMGIDASALGLSSRRRTSAFANRGLDNGEAQ